MVIMYDKRRRKAVRREVGKDEGVSNRRGELSTATARSSRTARVVHDERERRLYNI